MDDWVPVEGFPGYSVNPLGEVCNDLSGHVLASKVNQYGVVYVGLMKDNRQRQRSLALLVASAFIERPVGPMGETPINLDGDRYNNRVENLAWRPRWFAVKYNRQFKEGYAYPITQPLRNLETNEVYRDSWDCARQNGLLEKDLVLSVMNRTYTAPTFQRFGPA